QVPRRRARNRVKSELPRIRQRDGDHAILEAQRRQTHCIVLDEQVCRTNLVRQPGSAEQRRKTYGKGGLITIGQRQQRPIAPHVGGGGGNRFARKRRARRIVVISDF